MEKAQQWLDISATTAEEAKFHPLSGQVFQSSITQRAIPKQEVRHGRWSLTVDDKINGSVLLEDEKVASLSLQEPRFVVSN